MEHIRLIAEGLNIQPMLDALDRHPELWDRDPARTDNPESPHHGTSDIWCRFAPIEVGPLEPHDSIWYPSADHLPVKEMADDLMAAVGGKTLGGILITRIPPGASVKPHVDPGWHARQYEKFAVQIKAEPDQVFCFDDCSLVTKPGDCFTFDNAHRHWVTNGGRGERITAIFCIRTVK